MLKNIITVFPLVLCILGVSADELKPVREVEDYSAAELQTIFEKHTIIYTSEDSLQKIPISVLYGSLLSGIVIDGTPGGEFTPNDWRLTRSLPANTSSLILKPGFDSIISLCESEYLASPETPISPEIVRRFADASRTSLEEHDELFSNYVSSLSVSASKYLDAKIEDIKGSKALGYSSIDIVSLHKEAPRIVEGMIRANCSNTARFENFSYEDTLSFVEVIEMQSRASNHSSSYK